MGKMRGQEFSRLIMGGNLFGGWSHSRDLTYVSPSCSASTPPGLPLRLQWRRGLYSGGHVRLANR